MTKVTAIVLSAGSGKRVGGDVKKQYIIIEEKPILYYSLKTFMESSVDDIVLVVGAEDVEYVRNEIVHKYGFDKVAAIVTGGKERYDSVEAGLQAAGDSEYVLIHDGARPFVDLMNIEDLIAEVRVTGASILAVPSKDTVKISRDGEVISGHPDRTTIFNAQTPQAFDTITIRKAYQSFRRDDNPPLITDDAMLVSHYEGVNVHIIEGSYSNFKVTTKEDLLLANQYAKGL